MINNLTNEPTDALRLLKLIHLADSALPIGSAAHSFGVELLVAEELVTADTLPKFLQDYLQETGVLEATFCRAAYRAEKAEWTPLNRHLSARKPARESREASLALGRRFLQLFSVLEHIEVPGGDAHFAIAFGYAARRLSIAEDLTAAVYLQQAVTILVSACQRLMPVGQQRAARMLWDLKPAILDAAQASGTVAIDAVTAFTPLLEIASMRHVALETRLFIS